MKFLIQCDSQSQKIQIVVSALVLLIGCTHSAVTSITETPTESPSPRSCDKTLEQCHNNFDPEQCYNYTNFVIGTTEVRDCAMTCREDLETYRRYECEKETYCAGFVPKYVYCVEEQNELTATTFTSVASMTTNFAMTNATTSTSTRSSVADAGGASTTPSSSGSANYGNNWRITFFCQLLTLMYYLQQ